MVLGSSPVAVIPDNAGKVTRRRRGRTQAIANRYVFHANAVKISK